MFSFKIRSADFSPAGLSGSYEDLVEDHKKTTQNVKIYFPFADIDQ